MTFVQKEKYDELEETMNIMKRKYDKLKVSIYIRVVEAETKYE